LQNGYDQVFNLTGGIHGWSLRIDPAVKTYQ
jgi:rhodanese-related sulfurtransferase